MKFVGTLICLTAILSGVSVAGCAEFKSAGRDIGHATRDVARDVGRGARGAVKSTGRAVSDAVR